MNSYYRRFRQVLAAGVIATLLVAAGVVLLPGILLPLLHLYVPSDQLIWVRSWAMLYSVVCLAGLPAFIDPMKYRMVAWYTCLPRLTSATLWLVHVLLGGSEGFLHLALLDGGIGALQAWLLYKAGQGDG